MRKKANPLLIPEIAEGVAALKGVGEAASSAFDKAKGVLKPATEESKEEGGSEFQRKQLFNSLANTLKQMGSTNPQYTDPEQLFQFVGKSNIMLAPQWMQILEAVKEFLQVAMPLKLSDPELVDDVLNFTFEKFNKSGFSAEKTIAALDDLQEKAVDPNKDAIVVAILKKNFALAQILTLMSSFGKIDSKSYTEMAALQTLSTNMLGTQYGGLLRAQGLLSEKAKSNFLKLVKSRETYDALLPINTLKEHVVQKELSVLTNFVQSDFVRQMLADPVVQGYLAAAFASKQLLRNLGDSAIGEGAGVTGGITK